MKALATIISIGGWNPKIFTPDWVATNVFGIPEGGSMEMRLNERTMTLVFISNNVTVSASNDRLELSTDSVDEGSLSRMETLYRTIADLLPHTPVTSLTYMMSIELPSDAFNLPSVCEQAPEGYSVTSAMFSKSLGGRTFVIDLRPSNDGVSANFRLQPGGAKVPENGYSAFSAIKDEIKTFTGHEPAE